MALSIYFNLTKSVIGCGVLHYENKKNKIGLNPIDIF